MKRKLGAILLAGMFLAGTAPAATAGRGGGNGGGAAMRSGSGAQSQNQVRSQTRLRDGSCVNGPNAAAPGASQKRGKAYGPGDGTGPYLPQDGTGYGSPANR